MIIIEINLIFRIAETYMNDVDHLYTAFAPADDFTIVTVKCFFWNNKYYYYLTYSTEMAVEVLR